MKNRTLLYSVRAALGGLAYAYTHEKNFRSEVWLAIVAFVALGALGGSVVDYIHVLLVCMIVLSAEVVNTALERVVDIMKPHKHPYARVIKDLSAAFVLLSVLFAGVVGVLVYVPLLVERLFS